MREGLAKSAEDNLHPAYRRGLTDARKLGRTSKTGESPTEEFKESQKGELGRWGSILCGQTKGRWVYSRHSRDGHRRDPGGILHGSAAWLWRQGKEESGVQGGCRCELRDKMRKCNLPYPPAFPYSGLCGTKIAWDSWRQNEDMIFAIRRKVNF